MCSVHTIVMVFCMGVFCGFSWGVLPLEFTLPVMFCDLAGALLHLLQYLNDIMFPHDNISLESIDLR